MTEIPLSNTRKKIAFSQEQFDLSNKTDQTTTPMSPKLVPMAQPNSPKLSPTQPNVNVNKLNAKIQALELQIDSLNNENNKLIVEMNNMTNKHNTEVQKLLFEHGQKENEFKEKLAKAQQEAAQCKRQLELNVAAMTKKDERIENLKGIIARKESEIINLKSRLIDSGESIQGLQVLEEENKRLSDINKTLEEGRSRERMSYQTSVNLVKAECADQVKILTKRLAAVEETLKDTVTQKNILESSILEAQENSKCVLHESKVLLKKVGELEQQNSQLKSENSALASKNSSLLSEIQQLSQLSTSKFEASPASSPQKKVDLVSGSPKKKKI